MGLGGVQYFLLEYYSNCVRYIVIQFSDFLNDVMVICYFFCLNTSFCGHNTHVKQLLKKAPELFRAIK